MEDMTITKKGISYTVEFPVHNLVFAVGDIDAEGHRLMAEIGVTFRGTPLHRSSFNLGINSGRKSLCVALDEAFLEITQGEPADYHISFRHVVERMSNALKDELRGGVEAIRIKDVPISEGSKFRIDNLVVEHDANVLWGPGGTGKSLFCAWLAALTDTSAVDTQFGLLIEPGNVLYLDWETHAGEIASRLRMIHNGLGITAPSNILYQKMDNPLEYKTEVIASLVAEENIDLIVIDSMYGAVEGEMIEQNPVSRFFRALKAIGKTSLTISHANKEGKLYGNRFIENEARSVWEISQSGADGTPGEDGYTVDLSLFHRKVNNVPLQHPQSWQVEFNRDAVAYKRIDTFDTGDRNLLPYPDIIFGLLKRNGAMSTSDLYTRVARIKGLHEDKVRTDVDDAIESAIKRGTASKDDDKISISHANPGEEKQEDGNWKI